MDELYDPRAANQIKDEAADRIEKKYQLGKYDPFNRGREAGTKKTTILITEDDTLSEQVAKREMLDT